MIKKIYAVYDAVAQEMIGPLMVLPNDAAARRIFQDAVTNEQSSLAAHPDDYSLCRLGEIDTESGNINGINSEVFGEQIASGGLILEILRRRAANDRAGQSADGEQMPSAARPDISQIDIEQSIEYMRRAGQ